ncbi:hypothetical protein NLN94_20355, partial [Citrobacter portucalensis]|nr:hypothetical protein [Citrobacter portucalensis]
INSRIQIIEGCLMKTISRFEPRLTNIYLKGFSDKKGICFNLHANYFNIPVVLELRWDDCAECFFFNE